MGALILALLSRKAPPKDTPRETNPYRTIVPLALQSNPRRLQPWRYLVVYQISHFELLLEGLPQYDWASLAGNYVSYTEKDDLRRGSQK